MPVHPVSNLAAFDKDVRNRHLVYDYDAKDENGNPEKWRYEIWFYNEDRIVYAIHGGPMAGRKNFQAVTYQCIRPASSETADDSIWQVNWLEETGTICSAAYDLGKQTVTTLIAFSRGHWEQSKLALGDKRNMEDLERWRTLAEYGNGKQTDRVVLNEQASFVDDYRGAGDLEEIDMDWPCL